MEWNKIEENWKESVVLLQQKWPKLKEYVTPSVDGNRNEITTKIAVAYQITFDEAKNEINEWLSNLATEFQNQKEEKTDHEEKSLDQT